MSFARAFASLVVVALEGTVAAQKCKSSVVDTAVHTLVSIDRLRASIDRSLMASIAVSWQRNSSRGYVASTRAVRSRATLVLLRHGRQSADSGTEARSCSYTGADSH